MTDPHTTTDHDTNRVPFRPSTSTDALRPALLVAGAQITVSLVGAVLLTSGLLG